MTSAPGPRQTSRDLERYAGLFAARTKVMKSSAMRDLMALTERSDIISLAGGLPDTSSFPAASFAAIMSSVAVDSTARSLQYGPTEGLTVLKRCIAEVMAEEGTIIDADDVLVTTGGQQVIDLVCKTLIDPGDVIIAEAPTYPGAVPTFCSYQAEVIQISLDEDGMRIDELEATLDRLAAEGRRPKFIYTVPTFQNPGGTTMSLPRRRRLVEVMRERELLVLEDNPYGLLRYEGDPLPTLYALDGGDFVIYLGTFSKILSPGRAAGLERRAAAGAREDEHRQAGVGPVLVIADPAVRRRVLRERALAGLRALAEGDLPPPARRHARLARRVPRPGVVLDASAGRPVHLGHAARLHRHDRPARARARPSTSPSCPAARRFSTGAARTRCG